MCFERYVSDGNGFYSLVTRVGMEPVSSLVVGVAGNFVSDGLQHGYGVLSADDFRDCFDAAAERTAAEYGLDAGDFDALFYADLPAKDFTTFDQQVEKTPRRDFAARLRTETDGDLEGAAAVVDAFVRNVERELAATDTEHGLRLLLDYAHEFVDTQYRYEAFVDEFRTELQTLEVSIETAHGETRERVAEAHGETQDHVSSEHNETRAYLEDVIRDESSEASDDSLPKGFQRVSDVDFEKTRDVKRCWRIGFDFPEIQAGYAFERRSQDDGSATVVDDLRARLLDSEDVVVLGRPGSGKSTTCKQVACRWHARRDGPVFYADSDGDVAFDSMHGLTAALEEASGDCLVVVEDAIRSQANNVFDVVDAYRSDESVHFLLDARIEEWRSGDDLLETTETRDLWRYELIEYQLPTLTIDECRSVIDHFETATDESVQEPADRIHEELQQADGIGEMLLLGYYLAPQELGDRPRRQVACGRVNPLKANVRDTYDWLTERDDGDESGLALRVGVLIALLKTSRIGVWEAFVYALGDDADDFEAIERVLEACRGRLLFKKNGGYETHHERWASLFLEHFLKQLGERRATATFETTANALFSLLDQPDQRDSIRKWSRGNLTFPVAMRDDTQSLADAAVLSVFDVGTRRPKLASLFGPTEYSGLHLPDACSTDTAVSAINKRGQMYFKRGDYEKAEAEVLSIKQVAKEEDVLDDEETKRRRAWSLNNLGVIAQWQGKYADARKYHENSLELAQDLGDMAGFAKSLAGLGLVAEEQDEYDDAREYHEASLKLDRDLGNTAGISRSLTNLGVVAQRQGEYEVAREYFQDSLNLDRNRGNTAGIARNLGNLGTIAYQQDKYGDARKYCKDSLQLEDELGNPAGIASSLGNLGMVAEAQGEYEDAREYFERAGQQFRDLGAVVRALTAFRNLVRVTHRLGETESALEHCKTGIELIKQSEASGADEFEDWFEKQHEVLK